MDWKKLYFGSIPRYEIQQYIADPKWQEIRKAMLGKPLRVKYATLCAWLEANESNRASQVQITNYITALSRGGLIKPEDYREVK